MRYFVILVSVTLSVCAWGRNADDTLGTLLTPNEGRPAVATPGETIHVVARQPMALVLIDGDTRINLDPTWVPIPGGLHRAECAIPPSCPKGIYAIEGTTSSEVDRTNHAVFIGDAVEDSYRFAHVAAPKAEANPLLPIIAADIAQSDASLVVLTGELTATGSPQDYRVLLDFLRGLAIPTLVSPGADERVQFQNFFGPANFALRYGPDAYLALDPGSSRAVDLGPTPGDFHTLRRETRSARWSVGLAPAYSLAWDMRQQIALFVDNPLDFLLVSQGETGGPAALPWGDGALIATPPAREGYWRLITVERYKPSLGEIRQVEAGE